MSEIHKEQTQKKIKSGRKPLGGGYNINESIQELPIKRTLRNKLSYKVRKGMPNGENSSE